jgi:hypothetical protein
MRRRALLSSLCLLAAGCADRASTPTAGGTPSPTDTPSPTADPLPDVSKPGEDCTVADLPEADYPDLPPEPTPAAVEGFAQEFEGAYGAATVDGSVGGTDGVRSTVAEETDSGVLVWAEVRFDYTESEGDSTVAGSTTSHGWYYVTAAFAVRATGDERTMPESGWIPVACR